MSRVFEGVTAGPTARVGVVVVEIRIARTYDFLLKLIKQLYRTTCIESITN